MGFRPNYFLYLYSTLILVLHFTCTAHLCLLYKAMIYILSLRNTIQSSSISNMVSEPLLWFFISSFVFISVTPFSFSTSLPPSQPPPQPFAVEPLTSSSRRPWVPDLQPLLLRSFTLHRPLPRASSLQTLLRLRFWSYHKDRLAPIYKTVKDSTSSETARAAQSFCRVDHALHALPGPSMRSHAPARACFLLLMLALVTSSATTSADQDVDLTVDFDHWLWLRVDFDRWLFARVDFCSPGAPYLIFRVDFIFAVYFLHILLLNEE